MRSGTFKEVLVCLGGITPQIITETIYALSQREPPVYVDELFILTTSTGKRHIEKALIVDGHLKKLINEYDLPQIRFSTDNFIVPYNANGEPIGEIKDEEESRLMGNTITSFIRKITSDNTIRLHCSIAGGRKTMSFYLGSALQLFGRPWDKLYHVLVTPEFESNPNFFYKPKKDKEIETILPDGTKRTLNTRDAQIYLSELPFIRLRDKLDVRENDFASLIEKSQMEIDIATYQMPLTVNLSLRVLTIGSETIEMSPIHLALYTAFLRRKLSYCPHPSRILCHDCNDCFVTLIDLGRESLENMAIDYARIYGGDERRSQELIQKWRNVLSIPDLLRQHISKVNRIIRQALKDEGISHFYTICSIRLYAGTRYGIRLERQKILVA